MRLIFRGEVLSAVCLFLAVSAAAPAQLPSNGSQAGVATSMSNKPITGRASGVSLTLSVLDEKMHPLDRQAVVKLMDENTKTPTWQPTTETSDATFDVGLGKYDIEVSAVGYLTGRKEISVISTLQPIPVKIALLRDPDAVDFSADDSSTPAKASKDVKRAISDLKSGPIRFKEAQKHLDAAYAQAPASAQVNFLLGYLAFQQNDLDHAQTYLDKATAIDPHDVQALNLSGRLHLVKHDYAGAVATLEQAVAARPENATAHSLMADAYLNQKDYKNALAQADLAIAQGKSGTSSVQIVRGQALANLGHEDEAIQTLKTYLQAAPDTTSAPQVRQFVATLEQRHSNTPSGTAQPPKQ